MKIPRDINQRAKAIADMATGSLQTTKDEKNPSAVTLGRLGGLKGGRARAKALSKARREEIAKKAAEARWNKKERT